MNDLGRIADVLRRSTVEIRSRRRGLGAGVVWPEPRVVLTNAHVVGTRGRCVVGLADGRTTEGRVVRIDQGRDLALVEAVLDGQQPVTLRESATLRTGELVLAVGHPYGVPRAMSFGIIHTVDRRWIRADVRLAPGFSGGPLADAAARVVGLNTMIAGGLGLASPVSRIQRFLQRSGMPRRLGVAIRPVLAAGRRGYLVLEIQSHSAAEIAGLSIGDVIVALDGRPFDSPTDLTLAIADARAAAALRLEIVRGGSTLTLEVALPVVPVNAAA